MTSSFYRRGHEQREKTKTVGRGEAKPERAENTMHICYYCGQQLAGPPQDYDCPERPNETH